MRMFAKHLKEFCSLVFLFRNLLASTSLGFEKESQPYIIVYLAYEVRKMLKCFCIETDFLKKIMNFTHQNTIY